MGRQAHPEPGAGHQWARLPEASEQTASEQLKASEQIKSGAQARFLATMSHELRTPLNVVIGFSEAMMRDSDGRLTREQAVEYAASINEAGRQLLTLVDVILDVARVEAGHLDMPSDLIDMMHVIGTVVSHHSDRAGAAELTLQADAAPGLPFFRGDERRVRQALAHMVGNAIKFTPPGGSVRVSALLDPKKGDLLVRVADTGIGIAECDLQRAFEAVRAARRQPVPALPRQRARAICQQDNRPRAWRRLGPDQHARPGHRGRAPDARPPPRRSAVHPHP